MPKRVRTGRKREKIFFSAESFLPDPSYRIHKKKKLKKKSSWVHFTSKPVGAGLKRAKIFSSFELILPKPSLRIPKKKKQENSNN